MYRYYNKLKTTAKLAFQYYPEWLIRNNYDKSINKSLICEYECLNIKSVKYMNKIDFYYFGVAAKRCIVKD
jgi:hypothetical protein